MAKTQANYEAMYIINATLGDEDIAAVVEKFKSLIEASGTLKEMELMGKRRLAYPINDMPEGYYVLVKFTAAPDFPAELKRVFGITEGVIRALVTVSAD
ncbi:MAG: 30S ribosomal protein S6 [Clostridiales bacterium]|nr:30S ribosomal protein S6 [Clostridiales bacterium]